MICFIGIISNYLERIVQKILSTIKNFSVLLLLPYLVKIKSFNKTNERVAEVCVDDFMRYLYKTVWIPDINCLQ